MTIVARATPIPVSRLCAANGSARRNGVVRIGNSALQPSLDADRSRDVKPLIGLKIP